MSDVAAVTSAVRICDKVFDLTLDDNVTKLGREGVHELARARHIAADAHVKMERLLSLMEDPMAQYNHGLLLDKIQELERTLTVLVDVFSRFGPQRCAKRGTCLGRWCTFCGGNGHDSGHKARLHGLQQAVNNVKAAVDAVQLSSVQIGADAVQLSSVQIGAAMATLYQPPRQLAEVMKALRQGVKLVVVSGG
jgi:hypothetical protein